MQRILDIAKKDLTQLLRNRLTFLFTLVMPAIFTLLFGIAFGGLSGGGDVRLPLGFLDEDGSRESRQLAQMLADSQVVRLVESPLQSAAYLQTQVDHDDLAAAVIVPPEFGHGMREGRPERITLIADTGTTAGIGIESEVLTALVHLDNALRISAALEDAAGAPFDYTYRQTLEAWHDPPVKIVERIEVNASGAATPRQSSMSHSSPGMMMQFAIAGLLVSAQVMVNERKTRCLERMLTTPTRRSHILLGHFLAIFTLTVGQFALLIAYGQVFFKVQYLWSPVAVLITALTAAACIAGLGVLIGTLARSEEQAIVLSLVPMFVLVGLGGGWVPLEVVGPGFKLVGHLSPVAWAMDGFQNVIIRGLGVASVLAPAAALLGYAAIFLATAAWLFGRMDR